MNDPNDHVALLYRSFGDGQRLHKFENFSKIFQKNGYFFKVDKDNRPKLDICIIKKFRIQRPKRRPVFHVKRRLRTISIIFLPYTHQNDALKIIPYMAFMISITCFFLLSARESQSRTICDIRLPPIFLQTAWICARYRKCSGIPTYPLPKFIPKSP